MTWVRVDDQFTDHPKIVEAGPLAGWLFMCGLTYAARYLTDGFIPAGQVRRLADVDNATELAGRLVSAGLWEEAEGGYRIHDYLDYQPSAASVQRERAAARERMARRSDEKRPKPPDSSSEVRQKFDGNSASPYPYPVPVPDTSEGTSRPEPPIGGVAANGRTAATAVSSGRFVAFTQHAEGAQTVLDHWRRAFGKRSPPKLNPTQAQKLAEAVTDLGVERLCEAADWAAGKGLSEFAKTLSAAYTKRQHDEEHVERPAVHANGAASGVTLLPSEPGVYANGVRCECGNGYSRMREACPRCDTPKSELARVSA